MRYLIQLGKDGGGNISVNAQGERRKREKERGDRRIEREELRERGGETETETDRYREKERCYFTKSHGGDREIELWHAKSIKAIREEYEAFQ